MTPAPTKKEQSPNREIKKRSSRIKLTNSDLTSVEACMRILRNPNRIKNKAMTQLIKE